MNVSRELADFACDITDLPADALSFAERSLLDATGVMLAASGAGGASVRSFAQVVLREGGVPESTVIGRSARVPVAAAAFANGAAAHALDFEDAVDGLAAHPNAQVIPVVLALAEPSGATGREAVEAIAVGCDITARIADAAGSALAANGWYPPPLVGVIGATYAGARILHLTPEQTVSAVSLALWQHSASGEIKHSPGSDLRGVRDAFACQAAVRGLQLARSEVKGVERPLEGVNGFFSAYASIQGAHIDTVTDGLGDTYWGREVAYKQWPSCRGTHAFIQAALQLRTDVRPEDVARVELEGAPVNAMLAEPIDAKRRPMTAIDGKFSLPFTVALAFVDGAVTLSSFSDAMLGREDLRRFADLVTYRVDDDRSTPDLMTSGRTTAVLRDGTRHSVEVERPDQGNDDGLDGWLCDKFLANAALADVSVLRPEALARALLAMRQQDSVNGLFAQHLHNDRHDTRMEEAR